MVDAPFTVYRNTPNKSVRQDVPRRGVCLHHAAMTSLSGLRSLAMGGKQVSADAIVKNGEAEQLIPEGYRAWSLSSAYWDSALRSVETANESTNGWTVSDESHWTLARLVAYWAEKDGFYPHRDGDPTTWTVLGHREVYSIHGASYATACPGGLDLDLVTARAQSLLSGSSTAGLEEDELSAKDVAELKDFLVKEVLGDLKPRLVRNRDTGEIRLVHAWTGFDRAVSNQTELAALGAEYIDMIEAGEVLDVDPGTFSFIRGVAADARRDIAKAVAEYKG